MDEQDTAGEGDKVQVYLWKAVSIKALSLGGPERIEEEQTVSERERVEYRYRDSRAPFSTGRRPLEYFDFFFCMG